MKNLVFVFALLLFALPARAQLTSVSGTIVDANGTPYAGAQLKMQLVTTAGSPVSGQPTMTVNNQAQCVSGGFGSAPCQVPFQGTVGPFQISPTGTFTINLQDNTLVTPAATQWLFTANSTGAPPPLGTGPQVCTAQLTISGASQNVASSFNACPKLSTVSGGGFAASQAAYYASSNCGGLTNCSFVNANTHWVCDASTTNTSNIVTAPDGNFLTTAKAGQTVWALNSSCNNTISPLSIVETTILSVDSNTQIHTTAAATLTNAGSATLMWGTLDTPSAGNCATGTDNIKTAVTNANNAGVPLYLPSGSGTISLGGSGGLMEECSELQSPTSSTSPNPFMIYGPAWIIPTPNFDLTSVPAGNTGVLGSFTATFNQIPNVTVARDLTFFCGGFNNFASGSTHPLLFAQRVVLLNVTGWGCGANVSLVGIQLAGPSTLIAGMFNGFGSTACNSNNSGTNQEVVLTGTGYCTSLSPGGIGLQLGGTGNITYSYGNFYQNLSSSGGTAAVNLSSNNETFNSFADIIQTDATNGGIGIRNNASGGRVNVFGSNVYSTTEVGASFGLIYNGPGNSTYLNGSTITGVGGVLLGGGGTTGSVIDGGGNVLTGGTICPASSCSYFGATNSATGTLCATGNFALTSGWGTSTVSSVTANGNIQGCHVTITGAAGAAGPVLTWTYPAAPIIAPASCHLVGVSGTLTGVATGTPGATTVAFTFAGTPSAQTYVFDVGCP